MRARFLVRPFDWFNLHFSRKQALPTRLAVALFPSSNTHIQANPFKRWLKPEGYESHPMC